MNAKEYINILSDIYSWLEDEESKNVFLNRFLYLITKEGQYLFNLIQNSVPEHIIKSNLRANAWIDSLPKDNRIIIYGAGTDGITMYTYFEKDRRLLGFCDSDVRKQRLGLLGYSVIAPQELLMLGKNMSIIISSKRYCREMKEYLLKEGIEENRIFIPPFDMNVVNEEDMYFDDKIIKYDDQEIFIDAGCYKFDTSLLLKQKNHNLKKIYAFEPDNMNYQSCNMNKQFIHDTVVNLEEKGLWSEDKTLLFSACGNEISCMSDEGDCTVNVVALDHVVDKDDRVTFIKMDIEGSELEGLKGAESIIRKYKPKLAICIYHKPEDMLELPLYIKSLVDEYKIYMRHYSNSIVDTVLYAVVDEG